MKAKITSLVLLFVLNVTGATIAAAKPLHHYIFIGRDREQISHKLFLENEIFEGVQIAYLWRELEPEKDKYDFSMIREDLAFLTQHRRKLWIQLQDVTFSEKYVPVPRYLQQDPQYNGGADRQYEFKGDGEENARAAGWAARRWDPAVQDRFHKLLMALGKEFDGRIEGINFAESSVTFGMSGKFHPKGYTPQLYRDGLIVNLKALKRAFPKSISLQYANFMSGEWQNSKGYLGSIYQAARDTKVGVGGPDLFPYKPGQMTNSYRLINELNGKVPVGVAVQDGNYDYTNPETKKPVTTADMIAFATDYLKADYIFWGTEEPYFSKQTVPFLRALKRVRGADDSIKPGAQAPGSASRKAIKARGGGRQPNHFGTNVKRYGYHPLRGFAYILVLDLGLTPHALC